MTETAETFETWAVVELMGHNMIAGFVCEQSVAGGAMLRVDVPAVGDQPAYTKFFSGSAVYAITPTTEENARLAASRLRVRPVTPWVVPDRPALVERVAEPDAYGYEDEYEDEYGDEDEDEDEDDIAF